MPTAARQTLVHVRDYTKGHPSLAANNHPIRHGAVVGIHNGIIRNDEEVFAAHDFERAETGMTVDSEAIFALMELAEGRAEALEELYGSMATAWMDERRPETVYLARGMGRPLWIGQGGGGLFFASTEAALGLLERYAGIELAKHEVGEGTLLRVEDGRIAGWDLFRPDTSFTEEVLSPTVTVVARDASGEIIGAAPGWSDTLDPGQSVPFDAMFYEVMPEGTVYEAYWTSY